MAEVNYINPTAILPKQGWQPEGFMGGMQYAQQMQDYTDVMSLSKLMSQMGAQKEQEDLSLGAPVRASQRLSDIATNQATASTIRRLKEAQTGLQEDAAKLSRAGLENKILLEATKHFSSMGAEGITQVKNKVQGAQMLGELMAKNGPAGAALAAQMGQQLGFTQRDMQAFAQNPQGFITFWNNVNQQLQAELAKQQDKAASDWAQATEVAHITGEYNNISAQITADSRIEAAARRMAEQNEVRRLEQIVASVLNKQARGLPVTDEELLAANQAKQALLEMRAASVTQTQAGRADLLNRQAPQVNPGTPIQRTPSNDLNPTKIREQAIKAWGKYEPDKYTYGINPATGNFARMAK